MNDLPLWTRTLPEVEARTITEVRALLAASEAAARSVLPYASEAVVLAVFDQVCVRLTPWPASDESGALH